jgi:hypothetical protein
LGTLISSVKLDRRCLAGFLIPQEIQGSRSRHAHGLLVLLSQENGRPLLFDAIGAQGSELSLRAQKLGVIRGWSRFARTGDDTRLGESLFSIAAHDLAVGPWRSKRRGGHGKPPEQPTGEIIAWGIFAHLASAVTLVTSSEDFAEGVTSVTCRCGCGQSVTGRRHYAPGHSNRQRQRQHRIRQRMIRESVCGWIALAHCSAHVDALADAILSDLQDEGIRVDRRHVLDMIKTFRTTAVALLSPEKSEEGTALGPPWQGPPESETSKRARSL